MIEKPLTLDDGYDIICFASHSYLSGVKLAMSRGTKLARLIVDSKIIPDIENKLGVMTFKTMEIFKKTAEVKGLNGLGVMTLPGVQPKDSAKIIMAFFYKYQVESPTNETLVFFSKESLVRFVDLTFLTSRRKIKVGLEVPNDMSDIGRHLLESIPDSISLHIEG